MQHTTALDAALSYADRGWHVFPVQTAPNKRPLTDNGFHDATTDHAAIIAWWTKWPAAQVGVACGLSGLVTVDIDVKPDEGKDGNLALDELEMEHGRLGCGLVMQTPRGNGRQLFFADPDKRFRRALGVRQGIDLLGDGGYTIVPSPASPGREWAYGDPLDPDDLVPAPEWLATVAGSPRPTATGAARVDASAREVKLSPAEVAEIRHALTFVGNWDRSEWLKVGFALRSTGAGEQAYQLWDEWSRRMPDGSTHPKYKERDQRTTWRHAREMFADGSEITLATLFRMARDGGYEGQGVAEDEEPDLGVQINLGRAAIHLEPETGEPIPEGPVDIDAPLPKIGEGFAAADWDDVARMPPIEWQVDGILPRRSLAVLGGNTEAGKSFVLLDLCLHLIHGLPWCGREIEPGSVLYLCGEGHDGLAARLRAWRTHNAHRITAGTGGRYMMVSDAIPVLTAKSAPKLHEIIQTIAKAKGHAPSLIVIDTLSQALNDDENDSKVISPIMRGLSVLRSRWRATIMLAHHLVKTSAAIKAGQKPGGPPMKPGLDSLRGSGAITRNLDTVLGLTVEAGGVRELAVWKQKDGAKPDPVPLRLEVVETGRQRVNGAEETSCVIIPEVTLRIDGNEPVEVKYDSDDEDSDAKRAEILEAAAKRIKSILVAQNAVDGGRGGMTKSALIERLGGRRSTAYAAIEEAMRMGMVRDVGTKLRSSFLAVSDAVD